jgi:hypothetical protein
MINDCACHNPSLGHQFAGEQLDCDNPACHQSWLSQQDLPTVCNVWYGRWKLVAEFSERLGGMNKTQIAQAIRAAVEVRTKLFNEADNDTKCLLWLGASAHTLEQHAKIAEQRKLLDQNERARRNTDSQIIKLKAEIYNAKTELAALKAGAKAETKTKE